MLRDNAFSLVDNVLTSILTMLAHRRKNIFKEFTMSFCEYDIEESKVHHRTFKLGFLEAFSIATIYDGRDIFRYMSMNLSLIYDMDNFIFVDFPFWLPNMFSYEDKNFFCYGEDEYFELLLSLLRKEGVKYLRDGYMMNDGKYKCTFRFLT